MEFNDVLYGRRSIRKYDDKLVSEELVREVLQAAVMAPSGTNQQPWYFCAVMSKEKRSDYLGYMEETYIKFRPKLEQVFNNPEAVKVAGSFITSLGNAPVIILAFLLKEKLNEDITSILGVAAAVENLVLAAYDKGLGTCVMTAPSEAGLSDRIKENFAPAKGNFLCAITLGYPAQVPKANRRKEGRFDIV